MKTKQKKKTRIAGAGRGSKLASFLWTESEIESARGHTDLAWMRPECDFDNQCDLKRVVDGEYKDRRYLVSWKSNGIFLKSPRGENKATGPVTKEIVDLLRQGAAECIQFWENSPLRVNRPAHLLPLKEAMKKC